MNYEQLKGFVAQAFCRYSVIHCRKIHFFSQKELHKIAIEYKLNLVIVERFFKELLQETAVRSKPSKGIYKTPSSRKKQKVEVAE